MSFIFPQKVLFKHCDPAGMVFYPRYFEMISDCVEGFFETVGFAFETFIPQGGVPTAQIETKFLAPSHHGDQLELALDVVRIGGASLDTNITAECLGEPRFVATQTLVFVTAEGRSQKWPDPMRTAFQPYLRSTK